jgi:hypothetical protein
MFSQRQPRLLLYYTTNSKNKNIRDLYRGINKFKKGYQPRSNLVKDENGDLLADSHNILNRWSFFAPKGLKVNDIHNEMFPVYCGKC